MTKKNFDKLLIRLESKVNQKESGVHIVSPTEYKKLQNKKKLSEDCIYIIDDVSNYE